MDSNLLASGGDLTGARRRPIWIGLVVLAFAATARGQAEGDLQAIWNDPIFKKQFIASYGINAEVEPPVAPEEIALLDTIRPLMANDLPKAEETLRSQMKPDSSAILDFNLGGIQFQQDKMDAALDSYRKAVAKFPSFRRAWRNLGLINVNGGSYDAGISAFTRMIELGGGDAYAYGLLGFAHAAKQDYQPAEAAYRTALLLQPENTEWRLGLTKCVFRQGKFEDAAALLEVLIARYPEKADFWQLQAHTFVGMKLPLRAAENLEAMDLLEKATLESLQMLGDIYVNEGLMDLAARAYRRGIELDATQPSSRPLAAADLLARRGAIGQARALISDIHRVFDAQLVDADRRRLLKLEARINMGEGTGSAETAAVLEELVKLDPLDGDALLMLGHHYSRNDQPDRAIFYFERAASIVKFEAIAKIGHAQVLVNKGQHAEAVPLLRRAQEIRPREDIARYLEQVERIAKARR